ncbi:MAG: type II toxin-antitoxin system HicB family antitoxin [Chloroflexaceae bacterium]|nr:type II toxin-antitoxin system HicB family antitoxin [Chloroflexaceae bacterium]
MNRFLFPVLIEKDEEGYFASCPTLQGCYTQANSYEEALQNIRDAIFLHIEDRIAHGEEIPTSSHMSLTTVEVQI